MRRAIAQAGSYGRLETFADIGQTLAGHFGLTAMAHGRSLLSPTVQEDY